MLSTERDEQAQPAVGGRRHLLLTPSFAPQDSANHIKLTDFGVLPLRSSVAIPGCKTSNALLRVCVPPHGTLLRFPISGPCPPPSGLSRMLIVNARRLENLIPQSGGTRPYDDDCSYYGADGKSAVPLQDKLFRMSGETGSYKARRCR